MLRNEREKENQEIITERRNAERSHALCMFCTTTKKKQNKSALGTHFTRNKSQQHQRWWMNCSTLTNLNIHRFHFGFKVNFFSSHLFFCYLTFPSHQVEWSPCYLYRIEHGLINRDSYFFGRYTTINNKKNSGKIKFENCAEREEK